MQFPRLLPNPDGAALPLPTSDANSFGSIGRALQGAGKDLEHGVNVYKYYDTRARTIQAQLDAAEHRAAVETATEVEVAAALQEGSLKTLEQEEKFRAGEGDATRYAQTMIDVQGEAFHTKLGKIENYEVRREVQQKLAAHQAKSFPEFKKAHVDLIKERAEGSLAAKKSGYDLQLDQARTPDQVMQISEDYEKDVQKMSQLGIISKKDAVERANKYADDAGAAWLVRMTALHPERVVAALNSFKDGDRLFLARIDPKIMTAVLDKQKSDFRQMKADTRTDHDWNTKMTAERHGREKDTLMVAIRNGDSAIDTAYVAQRLEVGGISGAGEQELNAEIYEIKNRAHTALEQQRTEAVRVLTEKREAVDKNFWSNMYAGKPITTAMIAEMKLTLSPEQFEANLKAHQDVRDSGGPGNQLLTNQRVLALTKNSNAFTPAQIWNMKELNVPQRTKLFETMELQKSREKAAASDQNHFTNDPQYKAMFKQIKPQLFVVEMSPFNKDENIQAASKAEIEYNRIFEAAVNAGKPLPDPEATMWAVVKRHYTGSVLHPGRAPRFKSSHELVDAFTSGAISKDTFDTEADLLQQQYSKEQLKQEKESVEEDAGGLTPKGKKKPK